MSQPLAPPGTAVPLEEIAEPLRDGSTVLIRGMHGGDASVEAILGQAHPSSGNPRRWQCRSPGSASATGAADEELERRDTVFAALAQVSGEAAQVGVGGYRVSADGGSCECTVVVAEEWRTRGLGASLMRRLIQAARAQGIERMICRGVDDSDTLRELATLLCFKRVRDPDHASGTIHQLDLGGTPFQLGDIRPPMRDTESTAPRHLRFQQLLERCRELPAIRMAVVHPCDAESLRGALDAMAAGLIVPVLVGPEPRIRQAALEIGCSLEGIEIVPAPHSHAAADAAVALARAGQVDALMKGSLHTDELMHAVLQRDSGLRTDRRVSHAFAIDVPHYAHPLIVTDAAINILPDLETKRDICQNAIRLAQALGITEPRVAVLAAVETVSSSMPATIDAAALSKMADRGQIVGGLVDGPLAMDNAVSVQACREKGIVSAVGGRANILLMPNLEAGNMLVKQLVLWADAIAAGIVLGARVPIALTSRADDSRARIASAAIAVLLVNRDTVAAARAATTAAPVAG